MKTLYDVLGVSRHASADQIEQAHKYHLDSLLTNSGQDTDEDLVARAKAIKEAYSVLSSPERRKSYDAKLDARTQITYEVVEPKTFPWMGAVLAVILLAGGLIYKVQSDKAEVQRAELLAAKAKAEAEAEAKRAAAEEARLAQQTLHEQRLKEERERRDRELARREALVTHERIVRMETQLAREREQAERKAKLEQQREEYAAQARKRNEIAAMERALNIPIRRH